MHYTITISLPESMIHDIDEICIKQDNDKQEVIKIAVSKTLFEATPMHESRITISDKAIKTSDKNSEKSEYQIQNRDHSKVHALVIEDDKDARDVFVELLEAYNITVVGTGINGKEAIELYEKLHPDIIFMDLIMPTYDGYYGFNAIRSINPNAKIVFVTGASLDKNSIYKPNTTEIIEKPFQIDTISKIVKNMIEHR